MDTINGHWTAAYLILHRNLKLHTLYYRKFHLLPLCTTGKKKKKKHSNNHHGPTIFLGLRKPSGKVYTWLSSLEWICLGDPSASLQLPCILRWKLSNHSALTLSIIRTFISLNTVQVPVLGSLSCVISTEPCGINRDTGVMSLWHEAQRGDILPRVLQLALGTARERRTPSTSSPHDGS